MTPEQVTCPLCEEGDVSRTGVPPKHYRYSGRTCGTFCISRDDQENYLGDHAKRETSRAKHISLLLREWRAKRGEKPRPVLHFRPGPYDDPENTMPMSVTDLLAQWPETVPERIERCFCHLMRAVPGGNYAGREIDISQTPGDDLLIFAETCEADYFIEAMVTYQWVIEPKVAQRQPGVFKVCATPKGWADFDKLNRGQGNAKNPVFVAMWFGAPEHTEDPDRTDEMSRLYSDAIEPAIRAAGYEPRRADKDEHNEPIMDRVIWNLRQAPFVVADLTNRNNGVYYEAGFARGCDKEVILCCPESDKEQHFDISGLNQVRYTDSEDLKRKLESRILGTKGKGPIRFDGPNAPSAL